MPAEIIQFPRKDEPNDDKHFLATLAEWAAPRVQKHLSKPIADCDVTYFERTVDLLVAIRNGEPLSIDEKRQFLWKLDYLFVLEMRASGALPPPKRRGRNKKEKGLNMARSESNHRGVSRRLEGTNPGYRALLIFDDLPPHHKAVLVRQTGFEPHLKIGEFAAVDTTDKDVLNGEL